VDALTEGEVHGQEKLTMDVSPAEWEVSPRLVKKMMDENDDFLLLDVREPEEVVLAAIQGAQLIPMSDIRSRLPELERHAERPVVTFCHKGQRSLVVAAFLREQDFVDVRSMAGGIDAWSLEIDRSLPRY
jgi:rhodanese-related sulfurtransferase